MQLSQSNIVNVTTDTITRTKFYKTLTFERQNVVRKWANCKNIDNSINIIKAVGYEKWEEDTNTNYTNKQIIKELLQDEN